MMKVETVSVGFLNTNCYIAHNGESAAVIDPGADAERILNTADSLGVKIKYVFLTHAHFDHVLAASEILEKTGALLVANVAERERLRNPELSGQTMLRRREFVALYPDIEIGESGTLKMGELTFSFLRTPGHTEGSMCIFCEDTMFSGDTLFAGTCGRCDLQGGDYAVMLKSLRKLYELDGEYKVLPGHEAATTLSEERVTNPYMAEAMRQ